MEVVLICGRDAAEEDRFSAAFQSEMTRLLSKHDPFKKFGGLCVITSRQCISPGNPIIIFCGRPQSKPAGGKIAILEEDNLEAAALLSEMGIESIPCGMSDKNTLTISSSDLDQIQVCLQRSVTSLDGQSIDLAEYPFEAGEESGFPFLAAAATYILALGPNWFK